MLKGLVERVQGEQGRVCVKAVTKCHLKAGRDALIVKAGNRPMEVL